MMATTHALAGLVVAGVTVVVAPEYTVIAALTAVAGGVFPDLDLYSDHRKTLHYPVYYALVAIVGLGVAIVLPTTGTVGIAVFFLAAALHSVMDAFGGGLELRPWRGVSDQAVYDHYRDEWITPRRWIRYDGAPEDLVVAVALGGIGLLVYPASIHPVILGMVGISAVYTLLRKPLVNITERILQAVPEKFLTWVPERFVEDFTR